MLFIYPQFSWKASDMNPPRLPFRGTPRSNSGASFMLWGCEVSFFVRQVQLWGWVFSTCVFPKVAPTNPISFSGPDVASRPTIALVGSHLPSDKCWPRLLLYFIKVCRLHAVPPTENCVWGREVKLINSLWSIWGTCSQTQGNFQFVPKRRIDQEHLISNFLFKPPMAPRSLSPSDSSTVSFSNWPKQVYARLSIFCIVIVAPHAIWRK